MALNSYLHLKLDNVSVNGGVVQKGRENTIEVTSLEWSFDDAGNFAEIRFTAEADKALVPIGLGLKSDADVEALFDFWTPSASGPEVKYMTLKGTNGKVTSVNLWMLNNKDPNLMRYDTTIQYTMSFQNIEQTWLDGGIVLQLP